MTYLVMECRPGYAVVLGDDGRFLKVANLRYEVGQTVTDVTVLNLPESADPSSKSKRKHLAASLTAMAACLALVFASWFFAGRMPVASVYLTINPQIRIDVNRMDTVVDVDGLNEDGADLLAGYSHRKKDLDTVMDELTDRAIDMGYLHEGGTVTLSLDGDVRWVSSHGDHLQEHLQDHLTDRITVTIDLTPFQPKQAQPSIPTEPIVIPVEPDEDSDYGDSDYGADADPDNDLSVPHRDDDSDYNEPDDGQTDYRQWDTDESDYGTANDSGYSDYGFSDYD